MKIIFKRKLELLIGNAQSSHQRSADVPLEKGKNKFEKVENNFKLLLNIETPSRFSIDISFSSMINYN